ncbi:YhaN family protein [Komagataeibacter sp. FXV3]|uniref:YhaN family protein n=1 Tax=Komagataeibacter sp. FXV3 TaxID=2608998 RepID=UPI00187BBAFE|nr:YhaN family protein [Komagataeibacter sp. FXV3]MBE7728497.1 AAA family ATPase [Komagataeibacter sp. FXV3]
MRISNFRIVKYGGIADLDLDFGDGRGLHVIHGPNEAGKSTCLSALSDFLFGVPNLSTAGAMFGNAQIRLDAQVRLDDGQLLELSRHKGRKNTLQDPDHNAVPDSVLARPLGAMTRERFAALFGLNDETLRSGGAALLRANGDIGRLIVEAGGGLRALVERLEAIDARRNALFTPRRGVERAFYRALDDFNAARDSLREASLGHDAYTEHCRLRDEARQQKTDISHEQDELRRLHAHYERLEKAVPVLRDISRLHDELSAQADLAALPAGMATAITTALEACDAATTRHEAAVAQATQLRQQTAISPVQVALATLRDPIMQAIRLGQTVRQHRAQKAAQDEKWRGIDESLASLRQRLGKGADADLYQSMPDRTVLDGIRVMADTQARWRNQHDNLEQEVRKTDLAIAQKQRRMDSLRAAGHNLALHEDTAPFAALPTEMKRLALRTATLDQRQASLAAQVQALGADTVDQLRHLPCPTADGVQHITQAQHKLRIEHDRLASTLAAERERLTTLQPQLARLEQAGSSITPDMLATARAQRDTLWQEIRATYLHPDHDTPVPTRQVRAVALDAAMERADSLSAQLMAQADRIARIEGLRHDISHCMEKIAFHDHNRAEVKKQLTRQWQEFIAPFPALQSRAATPEALLAFIQQRAQVLTDAEQVAAERATLAEERIRPDAVRDRLRRLAGRLGIDPALDLPACVEATTAAMRVHASGHEEYGRLQRELDELLPLQAQLRQQGTDLTAARQAWQQQWASAMQAIGLPTDALPDVARDLATEWAAAPAHIERLAELHETRAQAHTTEQALAQVLDTMRQHLPLPQDGVAAAEELDRQWQAAEKARHQREALQPALAAANQDVIDSEASLSHARTAIDALMIRTHTDSMDTLRQLAARLAHRDRLDHDHAQARDTLSRMTDGQSAAELERALDGRDLPELKAEIAGIHDRLADLQRLRDNAVRAEQEQDMALRAFEHNTDAQQAAARREAAIASLHQIVEEYSRLTLTRKLIADAIDRVRAAQQDPLVTRAGQFLSLATLGAFTGIRTELDAHDEPVVHGVRHDGSTVPVMMMSAGTRDQLFLAFRLASVETYCKSAESLPFIADDLLVQFDDARSLGTLRVLADFARTTQVLLFTHHDSIRDMTRALRDEMRDGDVRINLQELPRAPIAEPVAMMEK